MPQSPVEAPLAHVAGFVVALILQAAPVSPGGRGRGRGEIPKIYERTDIGQT